MKKLIALLLIVLSVQCFAQQLAKKSPRQRTSVQVIVQTNAIINTATYQDVQSNFFALCSPENVRSCGYTFDANSNCIVSMTCTFYLTDTNRINFVTNWVYMDDAKGFNFVGAGKLGAEIRPVTRIEQANQVNRVRIK